MRTTLSGAATGDLVDMIEGTVDAHRDRRQRGPWSGMRQPVHTVYVPADQISDDTVARWGREAGRLLDAHAASSDELAAVFDVDDTVAVEIRARVGARTAPGREDGEEVEDRDIAADIDVGHTELDGDRARDCRCCRRRYGNRVGP